jgi:hypothetical protein
MRNSRRDQGITWTPARLGCPLPVGPSIGGLAFGWGRQQQRLQSLDQLCKAIKLGEDHIETDRSELVCFELVGEHREAYDLRLRKDTAQDRSRLDATQFRHPQVEEDQVATGLPCLLDGGDAIACLVANPVGGVELKEAPDGATHGGAVVNDEDSGRARGGHGGAEITTVLAPVTIRFAYVSVFLHFLQLIEGCLRRGILEPGQSTGA